MFGCVPGKSGRFMSLVGLGVQEFRALRSKI